MRPAINLMPSGPFVGKPLGLRDRGAVAFLLLTRRAGRCLGRTAVFRACGMTISFGPFIWHNICPFVLFGNVRYCNNAGPDVRLVSRLSRSESHERSRANPAALPPHPTLSARPGQNLLSQAHGRGRTGGTGDGPRG